MTFEFSVEKTFENLSGLRAAMRALTEQDVLIGIPEDKAARKEVENAGISNAYLGYIHEYGVPDKNIPARPALIPGIEDIQKEVVGILKFAAKKAMEGNAGAVNTALNRIGLLGQNAVRARFVNNNWAPLNARTLNARHTISESINKKGELVKKYSKSRLEKGRINPLINTGQLRKAYTYVIAKKRNQALIVR